MVNKMQRILVGVVMCVVLLGSLVEGQVKLKKIDAPCAQKITIGILSEISEVPQKKMKEVYSKCKAIRDASETLIKMDFKTKDGSEDSMLEKLNTVSEFASNLQPAW